MPLDLYYYFDVPLKRMGAHLGVKCPNVHLEHADAVCELPPGHEGDCKAHYLRDFFVFRRKVEITWDHRKAMLN